MTDPLRLDLAETGDTIRVVRAGFVVPPEGGATPGRASLSGVLDPDGAMVAQSISWTTSTSRVNQAPQRPASATHLPGRYIFGGILYGHFGHFIVESLARLWAQDAVKGTVDGMIFTPKLLPFHEKAVQQQQHLAELLGLRMPLILAREPLQVDELHVPAQGFGMNDLIEGSAAFRAFINTHAGAAIAPDGPEKLYISRSALPRDRGSILGEYKLEAYLRDEGYDIFHPQRFRAAEQIARYKAARLVVGVDCSPFHLLGYVGDAGQNVAVILRRSMEVARTLRRQLSAFKGMTVCDIDCLLDDWMPLPGSRPSRTSWGEIDFPVLHARLLASGHIRNRTPWPPLTLEERTAELQRLQTLHEAEFRSYRDLVALREAKAAKTAARAPG
jgi:hypothetical protein